MCPVSWQPKISKIEQLIQEEEARIEALREKQFVPEAELPVWTPPVSTPPPDWMGIPITPMGVAELEPQADFTPAFQPIVEPAPPVVVPEAKVAKPPEKEKPVSVPFWQRSLQVFASPFQWVDENVIQPGLALLGTTAGFVSEVERKPGEDFWEWKKRSWEGWKAPGININVPWSDEPWRVDMKGVMELAPWLLIPGAGTVGGGVRGAAGIAGMLSKAGGVGRVLGTAVEYSPWGLVEKTAGVAIKGGIRAIGKVSERVSTSVGERLFGKYVPPPVPPEVVELTQYFKQAVMPAYRQFRKAVPEEVTAKQAARIEVQLAKARRGEITYAEAYDFAAKARGGVGIKERFALTPEKLAARQAEAIAQVEARVVSGEISESVGKGLITKLKNNPAFTAIPFDATKTDVLLSRIDAMAESGHVKVDAAQALRRLLLNGELPERHNLRDFATAFGDDFAKAVGQLDSPRVTGQVLDALNIPRAVIASWDVSATGRQGLILSLLHPTQVPRWFGRQIKALFSEKWALEIDDVMRADPLFKEFTATGAYVAPLRGATFTTAEELFASRAARRIPGIRRSERAFATYLNQARFDSFKSAYNAMKSQGATPEHFKLLGSFLDIASGRGRIPASMDRFMPFLNLTLFSPRLQASILQLPRQLGRMLISGNPYMRKEAAKALVTFVGGGVGLLSLLNATGKAKVEIDPRSGDFGKLKIGETRLDIWRGYLQYARFAAQMLAGERKSAYGNMNKAERGEIAWRFFQSKGSPAFGLMVDLLRGETYLGDPIFSDTTGFLKAAREKVIPLAVQDIMDAMEQSGVNGIAVSAPAMLGVGVLTYINDFVKVKEKIAREMGYETWDDIDPKTQREIQNRNAELQAATIAFDRQVMGTAWGDWRLAGNAVESVFRENVDKAVAEYKQTGKGFQFSEKITDAFTARRGGYAAREKEERFADIVKRLNTSDTAEALIGLGPEQMAIKVYNDALFGDDMYDEFGNYRFEEARLRKEQLKQQLGDDMVNYIEDYRELKFETFPPEFQELMQAREVMRPYWEVRNRVVKLFGERFAKTSRGQSLITKLRKAKRMSDPEIERAYTRFYVQ